MMRILLVDDHILFREGLVDLISTDYISGYWDPILLVMQKLFEADLISLPKAVRMMSRFGEDIFYNAPGQLSGALVFFQYDVYFDAGSYIPSVLSSHLVQSFL